MSNTASEKFCLRWNDFEKNISTSFRELKDDEDFFDVTLVCELSQIKAHKVVLSACSPFFRTILKTNPHQHPLLYLKGISMEDMTSVLAFMYHGEVSVGQDNLNSFLAVAEDLNVKGLTQGENKANNETNTESKQVKWQHKTSRPKHSEVTSKNLMLERGEKKPQPIQVKTEVPSN